MTDVILDASHTETTRHHETDRQEGTYYRFAKRSSRDFACEPACPTLAKEITSHEVAAIGGKKGSAQESVTASGFG